ncbi:ABC transporter substrate-binding protein [Mesorhizobium sp. NPDC059054]|uniref:ABC transporter substrate-binding protein n=1 Tax=Mesorhizobium sp. NPDC059054 TaxID=3346711 RepID=UPI0036B68033
MPQGILNRRTLLGAAIAAPFVLSVSRRAVAASPARVVALDLLATEVLLTLGITPPAIANRALYQRLVAAPELPGTVEDLGPLTEPNAEYLQLLRPDLIVLSAWQAGALGRLSEIAPLHVLRSPARDVPAVSYAADVMRELGNATGRSTEASQWIERTALALADARKALADRSATPLYICRFAANGRNVAVFGGNGMIGDVLRQAGLTNAWRGRVNTSGVVSVGIEQLAGDPGARIVHFDRGAETAQALSRLAQSPLWNSLPAVRAGKVTAMPVIYPSGGVFSAIRFASQLVTFLPTEESHG